MREELKNDVYSLHSFYKEFFFHLNIFCCKILGRMAVRLALMSHLYFFPSYLNSIILYLPLFHVFFYEMSIIYDFFT